MMQLLNDVAEWEVPVFMEDSHVLVLIRGVPGSGKSTLAKKMVEHMQGLGNAAVHLESDMYVTRGGVYSWKPETVKASHEWCTKTAEIMLDNGLNVIVSNTFTKVSEMTNYFRIAEKAGVPLLIVEIPVRQFTDVHGVPESTIRQMSVNLTINNQEAVKAELLHLFPTLEVGYMKYLPEVIQCT